MTPAFSEDKIANAIEQLGLKDDETARLVGDMQLKSQYRIMLLEYGQTLYQQGYYYWARPAKLRIIAQVSDLPVFDAASPQRKGWILDNMASFGTTALFISRYPTNRTTACAGLSLKNNERRP